MTTIGPWGQWRDDRTAEPVEPVEPDDFRVAVNLLAQQLAAQAHPVIPAAPDAAPEKEEP